MTTEEKAKAYDIIIQRVTELYETGTALTREQMEHLFPELRESEDERIIEEIKFAVMQMPTERQDTKERCIAWLEKQKEQKFDFKLIKQAWYMEGYKDRDFETEPRWIIKTGEGGPEYELNPKYGQPLAKMQKPAEIDFEDWDTLGYIRDIVRKHAIRDKEFNALDKWLTEHYVNQKPAEWNPNNEDVVLFNKAVTTNPNLTPSERAKLDIIRMKFKHCNGHIATNDFDLALGERYIQGYNDGYNDVFGKSKPAEWSEVELEFRGEKVKVKRPFYRDDKGRGYSTAELDEEVAWNALRAWCEKKGISIYDLYPKAEWSEEDEKMGKFYEDDYDNNLGNMPMSDVIENRIKFKDWLLNRLKSLRPQPKQGKKGLILTEEQEKKFGHLFTRPSWKPSEEQMEALRYVAYRHGNSSLSPYSIANKTLASLYEQLKKL